MKGYKSVLLGKEIAPKDDEEFDENTPQGKEKKRLREANESAFTDLILSIDGTSANGRVAFNLIRLSKTKDRVDGDARMAWMRLQNKYATKSAPSLIALKKEFTNSRLESRMNDPDIWIGNLEDLRIRIEQQGSSMNDLDFMIHILNNLPKDYEISQAKLEDRLGDDIDPLTIEEIRTELNLKFQRMNLNRVVDDDEDEEETALFAGNFKGTCYKCGKIGHKKIDCQEYQENDLSGTRRNFNNWSNEKCAHCGKMGHISDKCWFKYGRTENANFGIDNRRYSDIILTAMDNTEENNKAGSARWQHVAREKCRNENVNFTAASQQIEFGAKEMEVSNNFWIGDSGASCHMTNDDTGLEEISKIDEEIMIGDGKPMKATKVGRMKMEMIKNDGSKQQFTLSNVKYVPELHYKVFSLTAALDKGFKIGNKGRVIILRQGDFTITFDNVLNTKTGFISGVKLIPRNDKAGRELDRNNKGNKDEKKKNEENIDDVSVNEENEPTKEVFNKEQKDLKHLEAGREEAGAAFPNYISHEPMIQKKEETTDFKEDENHKTKDNYTEQAGQDENWIMIKKKIKKQERRSGNQNFKHHDKPQKERIDKWKLKKKENGVIRERLNTCGYSQLPKIKMRV